jgi:hypothetical protein
LRSGPLREETMSQENKKISSEEPAIDIDYRHVDVARIMDEIKKKIAREPRNDSADSFEAGFESGEAPRVPRQKMRRLGLKIMSPFSPLIKLFILPVYEEHRQTVMILDQTNKRLDRLISLKAREQEYIKLIHNLCHNLVVELTKLKIEVDLLKTKVQIMEKDFEFLGKREKVLEKEIFK